MEGGHVRFLTYTEYTTKCKYDTIPKWSSTTFYRWKEIEEENYVKSPDKDEQLPQEGKKTTQRTTLKKMSSEGWKRQSRQWSLRFM